MARSLVSWGGWYDGVFDEAKERGIPILLGIGASWCHWCHVMDDTTYSDPDVADLINREYIAVRVDRDKRPDIDRRYNMGGWPSTVILAPSGQQIAGGTYIPPSRMKGMLQQMSAVIRSGDSEDLMNPDEFEAIDTAWEPSEDETLTTKTVEAILASTTEMLDPDNGGFGRAPKFPFPEAHLFLLESSVKSHNKWMADQVVGTMKAMRDGEVYDAVEGGFFRYATKVDWSEPHYEKLLSDNARLLSVLSEAVRLTGDKGLRGLARSLIGYLHASLLDPESGAYYGSQDADEKYYTSDATDRTNLDVPSIDKTIYADWSGMIALALLEASSALGGKETQLRRTALGVLLAVDERLQLSGHLLHYRSANAEPSPEIAEGFSGEDIPTNMLGDLAWIALASIRAYEETGEQGHLDRAMMMMGVALGQLWDERGGFYDVPVREGTKGHLAIRAKDMADNAVAAEALLRLGRITEDVLMIERAASTLRYFAGEAWKDGLAAVPIARVIAHYLAEPMKITVSDRKLLAAAMAHRPAHAVIVHDKTEVAAAVICLGTQCLPPVNTADELETVLAGQQV